MPIAKQEFYEGAALHILARSAGFKSLQYDAPFFVVDGRVRLYLKYSTRVRSPWGFTFNVPEQELLNDLQYGAETVIGLVCGGDGVAAVGCDDYRSIAAPRKGALRVACFRLHGEHYEVKGPDGTLPRKIPPSAWSRLLSK